jgi:hypothetical protein
MRKISDVSLLKEQQGIRKGHSCIDKVFMLKKLMEKKGNTAWNPTWRLDILKRLLTK